MSMLEMIFVPTLPGLHPPPPPPPQCSSALQFERYADLGCCVVADIVASRSGGFLTRIGDLLPSVSGLARNEGNGPKKLNPKP